MHVLIGPGHHALKRSMAQAALAALLIAATPAAGVQWIAWLVVGCSVLIGTAALLVVWPGEHAGGFSQEISMQSQVATLEAERSSTSSDALRLLVLPGRALYALIFLIGALNNFSHQAVGYAARQAGAPGGVDRDRRGAQRPAGLSRAFRRGAAGAVPGPGAPHHAPVLGRQRSDDGDAGADPVPQECHDAGRRPADRLLRRGADEPRSLAARATTGRARPHPAAHGALPVRRLGGSASGPAIFSPLERILGIRVHRSPQRLAA